ncbi:MFS transporter [Haladaptatus cibarius]|uniref:MFS transporter n=1 Tax=Haladaptatus cibarius TaxID=453847 RepID=UPI0006794377|nr:MFS transporter [Haladaptatus cibarius]
MSQHTYSSIDSLIIRFYSYRGLTSGGFVYPILTVHALAQGLDLAGVGLAAGMFFAGTLLGEIPTGYVGDRIGRRNSLFVGSVLISVTHFGFAFADSLAGFVFFWGFWGLAATFRSGSTDAWLYDTLTDHEATETYTRVRGRATGVFYASAAISALVGGALYENWSALPFLLAGVLTAIGALVVLTLPEPAASRTDQGFSLREARTALVSVVSNRTVRSFVILSGIVLAVPETVEVFVQPVALSIGFRPSTLGPLYAGLMLAAAVGSSTADAIGRRIGVGRWFVVGPTMLAVVLILASSVHAVALPVFFLSRGANTVTDTLGSTFVNDRVASHGRATTLSGVSMVHALVFLVGRTAGGAVADVTSPLVALAGFGCLAVGAVAVIRATADPFSARSPVRPEQAD